MDFSMSRRRFMAQTGKVAMATGIGGSLLAACGESGGGTNSGPVTLTYGWWSNTPAKDNSMKAWIKDFEKSHPNIKIKPEILPWGNYWDKLKTTTAGGNAYDIIGMSSGMAAPYFDSGALADLTSMSGYNNSAGALSPVSVTLSQWNGKTLALPIGTSISVLGYNKALFDAAGLPAPDPVKAMTFDEFKAIAKKLTKFQGGKAVQYAINPNDILDYDMFVRMNGGKAFDNPVNPTKVTINTPEGIQGLKDYKSLFTEKMAPPFNELTNGPWSFDIGALDTGKIAFARVGPWLFSDMAKNPNYGITPIFTIKQPVITGGVNSLAIYKNSKNKDAAWEFLKWATQTDPEISFAKFSDIPAEKKAFSQLNTYIQPSKFAPTMESAFQSFQPSLMTTKDQLATTINDIITDMMAGKVTPEQAAAKIEQQGNSILSAS
ncbi:sugar ABC transporter substrate-binding protein [Dictyobacter alpinus]|uniref:Sugar ABC transporter substrate-binding protein n=1 Tax=Dictyobacter alpinus TaxID=2014873 RepID=A0A402BG38_9CHLR|nr:sugar ABC transporter substrate-binding protein [Dictyobacter alpinus]GCE30306.1 sugar ABC transporter substrate-binding protein [Dictyobacter alpinus]GCE30338.1 sugar ABC transporter substrate-binding protein [Dictyobacter alpinus]